MRAWRRSPFTHRFLLARCVCLVLPLLLGWASAPAQARVVGLIESRVDAALEQHLGRSVEFEGFELDAGWLRLNHLRAPRRGRESVDPIRVDRVELELDWSLLIWERRLRVTRVRLERPRLRLPLATRAPAPEPATQLTSLLQSGLARIEVRDGAVQGAVLGRQLLISGLDAELSLAPGELSYEASVAALHGGAVTATELHVEGTADPSAVRVNALSLRVPRGRLNARGALQIAAQTPSFSASGRLELEGLSLSPLPELRIAARQVGLRFQVQGPLRDPQKLSGEGRFELESVELESKAFAEPLALRAVRGNVALAEERLAFSDVVATADGMTFSGRLSVAKTRVEATLVAGVERLARLRRLLPELELWRVVTTPLGAARARVDARLRATLGARPALHVTGGFELDEVTLRAPDTELEPWPLLSATGHFALSTRPSGPRLTLTDVDLRGRQGRARGRGELDSRGLRLQLEAQGLEPELLGRVLPGEFRGGLLGGTLLVAAGSGELPRISGDAEIVQSRWQPPADAPFHETMLDVRRAAASYDIRGERFEVARFEVNSAQLHARGAISGKPTRVRVETELRSSDTGSLLDAWPDLRGMARGGRGSALLTATWTEDGVHGTLQGNVRGGTVLLPSAAGAEHTAHPLSQSGFTYQFAPDHARLTRLGLRGPEVNLDLDVAWDAWRRVSGSGRAWLTRAYASELAGVWKMPLVALGRFPPSTPFTLRGDADQVRLDAAIAHGVRWRLLRLALPKRLSAIARGETPVWRSETPRRRF